MKIETPYEVGDVVWVLHKPGAGGLYEPMRGVIKQITVQIYGNEAEASYAVEEKLYDWFKEVFPSEVFAQAAADIKNQQIKEAISKLREAEYRGRLETNRKSIERLQKDNEEIEKKLKEME